MDEDFYNSTFDDWLEFQKPGTETIRVIIAWKLINKQSNHSVTKVTNEQLLEIFEPETVQ